MSNQNTSSTPATSGVRQAAANGCGGTTLRPTKETRDMPNNRSTIIAALLLGLGAFVLAWFQSGPRVRTGA